MRPHRVAVPGLLLAQILLSLACGVTTRRPTEVVVVLGAVESGRRGASLAEEDLEDLGIRLQLAPAERAGDEGAPGISTLLRIVEDSGAVAVIGLSGPEATLAAAHALEQRQVLLVVPDSTSALLGGIGRWIFRLCPSDRAQAELLASHALRRGYRRVGMLYSLDDSGKGLAAAFSRAFARGGGKFPSRSATLPGWTRRGRTWPPRSKPCVAPDRTLSFWPRGPPTSPAAPAACS